MKKMNIDKIEKYSDKVYKVLDNFEDFCNSIESETVFGLMTGEKDLELEEMKEKIRTIDIRENKLAEIKVIYKEKVIVYLYKRSFNFLKTNKVNGTLVSQKFLSNMTANLRHQNCVHHST